MSEEKERSERNLDPNIKYTVNYFEKAKAELLLPEEVRGAKVLDIGAGQSDIVATLRERGAEAFAVDPAYDFPEELDQRTCQYLKQEALPDKEWYERLRNARERFRRDFEKSRQFYKPARSTLLPFGNDTFDLVISSFCICPIVSKDYLSLEISIKEILRVLKPLSQARIYPWDNTEDVFEGKTEEAKRHQENLDAILKMFDSTPHGYGVYPLYYPSETREALKVRKGLFLEKSDISE